MYSENSASIEVWSAYHYQEVLYWVDGICIYHVHQMIKLSEYLILASNIPHCKANILVLNRFHIKTWSRKKMKIRSIFKSYVVKFEANRTVRLIKVRPSWSDIIKRKKKVCSRMKDVVWYFFFNIEASSLHIPQIRKTK